MLKGRHPEIAKLQEALPNYDIGNNTEIAGEVAPDELLILGSVF